MPRKPKMTNSRGAIRGPV